MYVLIEKAKILLAAPLVLMLLDNEICCLMWLDRKIFLIKSGLSIEIMGNETFYINKLHDMNICFKSTQSSFTGLSIKPKNKIMLIILLLIKQIKIIKNIIKKNI